MKKYVPSSDEYAVHVDRVAPVKRGDVVKRSLARTDTTYFVVNQLGLTPYTWQSKFWDVLNDGSNLLTCTARQVGKTFSVAAWCLWAITYNTLPIAPDNRTHVILVSASEEQSKKIIGDVKKLMRVGDEHVYNITSKFDKSGKIVKEGLKNWFTNQINRKQEATNTKSAISFLNGCDIISLPPTERARGYTGSILFIDEAGFIIEEDIWESTLKHIVAKTGNRIGMASTPNGQSGFFFKLFDPEENIKDHTYKRLWMTYEGLIYDDEPLVLTRRKEKKIAEALGNEKQWMQEQEAEFTSSTSSFFDSDDVDKGMRKSLSQVDSYDGQCDLAVDFGKVYSRTVITITALEKKGEVERARLLYEYEYPPEKDLTLMDDIADLKKRFAVQRVIFEDCPQSHHHQQDAERRGWNLHVFNPTRDKAKKYAAFRSWLRQGKIVYPEVVGLMKQMKGLVQEETPRTTKIFHGPGLRDDRIDSFMLSTVFFTEERSGLRVWRY